MTDAGDNPVRLRRGYDGWATGWFWAWPIDGYYDLHFVADGAAYPYPDGSDVYEELIPTLAECRRIAKADTVQNRMLASLS